MRTRVPLRRRVWRIMRYLPAVVVLVTGYVVVNRVAGAMSDMAREDAVERFDDAVERTITAIDQDMEAYLSDLGDIAAFTGTHNPPTPENFHWFVGQSGYLDPDSRQLLIYIERVEVDELGEFIERERVMRNDPDMVPLSLTYGSDGRPMMFITRANGVAGTPEIPVIDVSAIPLARDVLLAAGEAEGPLELDLNQAFDEVMAGAGSLGEAGLDPAGVLAPVLDYVRADPESADFGFALVVPVRPAADSTEVSGWIVGGLDPPDLLDRYNANLGISVRLGNVGPIVAEREPAEIDPEFRAVRHFESEGIEFRAEFSVSPEFETPPGGLSSGVAEAAGYVMAGLVALFLGFRAAVRGRTQEMQDELQDTTHRASHDPLTGLLNRAAMRDLVEHLCETRTRGQIGLLFIDLDRLKIVNDSLGHSVGDVVLRAAAERLCATVGGVGVVSRFGGDEFVVVMADLASVDQAVGMARQIVVALNPPLHSNDLELSLTASIGIACAPARAVDAETLVRDADAAMYEAKAAGGNGYAVFDETLREKVTDRLELENALRNALAGNELTVWFQPVVDVARGSIVSVEALVRWDRGEMGLVGPLRFLPVANETGLIVPIGDLVVDRACELAARLQPFDVEHPIGVAINLSERELLAPRVVERIGTALARYGVPPELLTIEINEDVVVDGHGRALDVLRMLEHLGVRLAIDDFGTGLSSLGHVKRLEMVSMIKIDKTFVSDIDVDEADQAIVSAVVAMSATLGHDVVAEGVERPEQVEMLRGLGVTLMQGHRWSPAVPADRLLALVEAGLDQSGLTHADHEGRELGVELVGVGVVAPAVSGEDPVEADR